MRSWHSLFEILRFPLEVVFLATILSGIGNLIVNPSFGLVTVMNASYIETFGMILQRTGNFILINFPMLFMIRFVTRKGGSGTTVLSALGGYMIYTITTMYVSSTNIATTAYSSILGLSAVTTSSYASSITKYPLQTGMIGSAIIAVITLLCFNATRKKSEYGLFSFISKELSCTIRIVFFSFLAGILVSLGWPYFLGLIQRIVNFISVDTTNPINLTLYGICDRFLSMLNLGTLIRQPFWYTIQGGSWVSLTGASVVGDVNVWSSQLAASALNGMAGRFITPYYILNIFAIPAMLAAICTLETDPLKKRKVVIISVIASLVSIFMGTLLPIELMLLFLCPLLLFIHFGLTGILFGVLQGMHIYLGYNTSTSSTMTAMPGTLSEFLTYIGTPSLQKTLLWLVLIGIIAAVVYFFVTRLYFTKLALDLFKTGEEERAVRSTIKACGGIENIRNTGSSITTLTVSVYNPSKLDTIRLKKMGSFRIYETRSSFNICFGASSTMIRKGIEKAIRESVRETDED